MSDNLQQYQLNSVFCLDGNYPVSEYNFVLAVFEFLQFIFTGNIIQNNFS